MLSSYLNKSSGVILRLIFRLSSNLHNLSVDLIPVRFSKKGDCILVRIDAFPIQRQYPVLFQVNSLELKK